MEFVIVISDDRKSTKKIVPYQWAVISETRNDESNTNICDIIIQPDNLYQIFFSGERFQFTENSELRVRIP